MSSAPDTSPSTSAPSADRVSQILVNLLDNARRHTPAGGTVTVTVREGGPASVVVSDTGPGIPQADRERVLDRLVRLEEARDRDSGGAGLGLPVARALATAHGGDLVAEPAQTGARLRPTLPGPPRV